MSPINPGFDFSIKQDYFDQIREGKIPSVIYDIGIQVLSSQDIEDYSDDFQEDLSQWIIEKPEGHHLIDTNLVVFRDEYTGPLPLNGIKQSDFVYFESLLDKIQNGESKLSISGNPEFKEEVYKALKKNITLEAGRDLLQRLEKSSQIQWVIQETTKGSELDVLNARVNLNPKETAYIVSADLTGKKQKILVRQPFHTVVAHELTHCLHVIEGTVKPDGLRKFTLKGDFTDLEEQRTITGLYNPIEFKEINTTEEMAVDERQAEMIYHSINENRFAMNFGLYHRISHEGLVLPTSMQLEHYKDLIVYHEQLVKFSFPEEAEEFLKEIDNFVQQRLLHPLSEDDKVKMFDMVIQLNLRQYINPLLDKEVDLNSNLFSQLPWNFAVKNQDKELLEMLLKNGISIDTPINKGGTTPLMAAIEIGSPSDFITFLLDRGADVLKEDKNNNNAFQYAINTNNSDILNILLHHYIIKVSVDSIQLKRTINTLLLKILKENRINLLEPILQKVEKSRIPMYVRYAVSNRLYQSLSPLLRYTHTLPSHVADGTPLLFTILKNDNLLSINKEPLEQEIYNTITLLLDKSIDLNVKDENGNTFLMELVQVEDFSLNEAQKIDLINKLIDRGLDLSIVNNEGKSVLSFCSPQSELFKFLADKLNPSTSAA